MYKRVSKVGFRFFIFAFVSAVIGLVTLYVLDRFYFDFTVKYSEYITLALTILCYYVIGYPLVLLMTRKIPNAEGQKNKLRFGVFLKYIAITAGLAMIGVLIGIVPHFLITMSGSKKTVLESSSDLIDIIFGTNQFAMVFVVGILAPIFEELLFRKILVDKLAGYGETLAIVASGLMFGLFHGNFQQGVFAMLIGGFFAYVYLRTRKIIYTILLHMCVNLTTSVGTVSIYKWFLSTMDPEVADALLKGDSEPFLKYISPKPGMISQEGMVTVFAAYVILGWVCLLASIAIVGIVYIIISLKKKQFVIMPVEGEKSKGKQIGVIFISWGMLLFFAVCVFSFFKAYTDIVPNIYNFVDGLIK